MTKHLIETLTKHSSKVIHSQTTNSVYFIIEGIKVRVSDHHTASTEYDLAVYSVNGSYLCIPANVPFKQLFPCSKVVQVLEIIKQIAFAKRLYVFTPEEETQTESLSEVFTRLRKLGLQFKDKSVIATQISALATDWIEVIEDYWNQSSEKHQVKQSRISTYIAVCKDTQEFKQKLFKTVKK
jgi:hypothetical protein